MRPRSTSGTTSKRKGSENFKIQDTRRSLSPFFHQLAWRRSIFFPLPFFWHFATERLPFDGALLQAKVRLLILYTLVSFFVSARMVVASSFGHHREKCSTLVLQKLHHPFTETSSMEDDSPWHDDEVYTADGAGNAAAPGAPTRIAEQEWNNLEQRYADVSPC